MSVMRDYRPRPENKKREVGSSEFVAWGTLICLGMCLGFIFGYGLLYT